MTASLTVPRKKFVEALKMFRKTAKKKGAGEAILSYESGMLTIQISGVVARAEAHGDWPGEVRVSGRQISNLWNLVPPGDPVELSVYEDKLQIETLSIHCVWQQKDAARIYLPLDAPLPVILSAALKYTPEEITSSGLADVVRDAEEKRDELIDRAVKIIDPLDISCEELRRFVDEQVRRIALPNVKDE